MKWVKFKNEFYEGTLNRFLKNGDNLHELRKSHDHTHEPKIFVSDKHDYIIDNCFRIYETDHDTFKEKFIYGEANSSKKFAYHKWHYASGLPEEYFDITYFDRAFIENNNEYFLERNREYFEKKLSEKDSKTENEQKYLIKGYGAKSYPRPHPFEIYCGGWVDFFDEQVRRGDTDHALYFDWHCKEKAVSVYILQTKLLTSTNINVNVNITNPPTSTDPPPAPPGKPPC